MALSKEVKIGFLAVTSLVIFFIGFYFLKGTPVFSSDKDYYCFYTNVEGLQNSANVQIQGMNVGRVSSMHLEPGRGVKVTLSISKAIALPKGTVASLESFDLLGTKMIRLDLGPGPEVLKPRSELTGVREGGIVDNVSAELTPRLRELKSTIVSFDTTLAGVSGMVTQQNQAELAAAIHSIKVTGDNLAELSTALKSEGSEINAILHNANSITANLAKKNDTISLIMDNLSSVSRQLANTPIQKTVTDLHETIIEIKKIADKVNNNEGSMGLLINNKEFYNNLNSTLRSLDSLEKDIKAHPHRYINVTIFGKAK